MDGLGQTGNGRSGDHESNGVVNGHAAAWATESWSSAGAALEPSFESVPNVRHLAGDRRGIEALTGGGDGVDNVDDSLTTTLVRPPHFVPFSATEDPYADELAQRSAEFARHAAFDDPTPPQGLPSLPPPWATPVPPPLAATEEHVLTAADEPDPPLAASLSLGQRFEMAFAEEFSESHSQNEHESLTEPDEPPLPDSLPELPQRVPGKTEVPPNVVPADDLPPAGMPQLSRIADRLRDRDYPPEQRPDGFDTEAVLNAVREVAGVREATMRTTPTGAHHLRLELAEGVDPGMISRMVARMLQEQMGLDAALANPPARPDQPFVPGQPDATGAEPPPPPVTLPGPRTGLGATPPSAAFEPRPEAASQRPQREPRRRHPVSVPRRQQPSELRPPERIGPTWRSAGDTDQSAGASPPPLLTDSEQGPRAIIEHVQTSTFGLDATVEVRLGTGERQASGVASGPAVDAYVLRLCAAATAAAVDDLLREGTTTGESGRCFVEHAAIVPMGGCDVAVVVVLLACGGWVEQLAGSALVSGDPRRAVVQATLAAVNRRLAGLLPSST